MKTKNINYPGIILLLILLIPVISLSQTTPDPGLAGPYIYNKLEYDLGDLAYKPPSFPNNVEVRGSVHYPDSLKAGPYPVILMMHGRHVTCYKTSATGTVSLSWPCISGYQPITSYQGYDYLAQQLASHGYIVISVSANAINASDNSLTDRGMAARAELLQYHLNLWKTFNTTGAAPFNNLFVGKLDLQNVGTIGHSRGGEGVITHALLNKSQGSPFGIKAVLTLAPVAYNRKMLNNIPVLNIAPYCDGDVANLAGVRYYDDVRYNLANDEAAKHSVLLLGANHNFFNTVWTPGMYPAGTSDDWNSIYGTSDSHCGTGSTNKRFTIQEQQAALKTYASAFFRYYLGNETAFAPILKVEDRIPPASSSLESSEVFVSYHPPASQRLDVNKQDTENSEITNSLNGSAASGGMVKYDICADDLREYNCGVSNSLNKEPHSGTSSKLGMSQLGLSWNGPADYYENNIPVLNQNFMQYKYLQFRAAIDFSEYFTNAPLDFSVQLIDAAANVVTKNIGSYTQCMYYPPGKQNSVLPKVLFNSIKIPLADFVGVDLSQIRKIKFLFNKSASGSIYVVDLALSEKVNAARMYEVYTLSANTNLEQENAMLVYPNPGSGLFNVQFSAEKSASLVVYNLYGQKVWEQAINQKNAAQIDLSAFEKGLYLLKVQDEKQEIIYKLIKQ